MRKLPADFSEKVCRGMADIFRADAKVLYEMGDYEGSLHASQNASHAYNQAQKEAVIREALGRVSM